MIRNFITVALLLCSVNGFAADFYVSASGSGGNGTSGNPWSPAEIVWTTVDNEESTVYLMSGTYTGNLSIANATANRIYIRPCSYASGSCPEGSDGIVLFQRAAPADPAVPGITINIAGNNITIDGSTTSENHTRNVKIIPGNNYGIVFSTGKTGNVVTYIEITGMADEKTPAECSAGQCQVIAIYAGDAGNENEISYNYLHGNWGHCDAQLATQTTAYGGLLFHHNTIETGTLNYLCGTGKGVDVYSNTLDITDAITPYDMIHFYNEGLTNIRVYKNTIIADDTQAIFLENPAASSTSTENIRIYDNIVRCGTATCYMGIAVHQSSSNPIIDGVLNDVVIANNTFVGASELNFTTFLRFYTGTGSTTTYTNLKVVNNIFYNIDNPVSVSAGVTWANEADAIFNGNLIYHASAFSFQWLDDDLSEAKAYANLTVFEADHPTYADNAIGNPSFAGANDFHLNTPTSPAYNAGLDLSGYIDMPVSWPDDKDSTPRPQGAVWDIGAYEFRNTLRGVYNTKGISGYYNANGLVGTVLN